MRIYINIRILIIAGIYTIYKPLYIVYIKLFEILLCSAYGILPNRYPIYVSNHIPVPETVPICTE